MTIKFTVRHVSNIERELQVPGFYAGGKKLFFITEKEHILIDVYGVLKYPNHVLQDSDLADMQPISMNEFVTAYKKVTSELSQFVSFGIMVPSPENIESPYGITNIQEDHD